MKKDKILSQSDLLREANKRLKDRTADYNDVSWAIAKKMVCPKIRIGNSHIYTLADIDGLIAYVKGKRFHQRRTDAGYKRPTYREMRRREPLKCQYLSRGRWLTGKLLSIMAGEEKYFVETSQGVRRWVSDCRVSIEDIYGPSVMRKIRAGRKLGFA